MPAELTNAERETAITMTADNREVWNIGSDDPVMIRRIEAVGAKFVRAVGEWREYTLPANQVSLRNPSKLTEEQRQAMAERAKLRFSGKETA